MKEIVQLAETTSSDVSGVIPEIWSKRVEEAAIPLKVFRSLIRVNTELLNSGGDKVHIPRRQTLTATAISEGGTISPSTLVYGTALTLGPNEVGCGVKVSKQAVQGAIVNLLQDCSTELAMSLAQLEDTDIASALSAATTNKLYGGDATGTADIASGDVLTPTKIAEGIKKIRHHDFNPEAIDISPEAAYHLGTCEQFSSAAVFGSDALVKGGIISKYLGVQVKVSTNVPAGTGGVGTDVPYHTCILMDSKRAGAIAIKRNPTIETLYEPFERKYKIAATEVRDQGLLNDASIVTLCVSDS